MFKFKIQYGVENFQEDRVATVFEETLEAAVEKVKLMDPEYSDIITVDAKEYPHWNSKGGDRA